MRSRLLHLMLAGSRDVRTVSSAASAGGRTVRLYTPQPLMPSQPVLLTEQQRHKLSNVMRVREGGTVAVFNGNDGEWLARIDELSKRRCALTVSTLLRPQPPQTSSPRLIFGMIKSARLSMLVEKATELGVGSLQPVLTQYCSARSLNVEKLTQVAAEAAEQSRRLTVPEVHEPVALGAMLAGWDVSERLLVCDERGGAVPLLQIPRDRGATSSGGHSPTVLIGPEGGFSPEEFEAMAQHAFVQTVSLGPNILRAETAALAALAVLACHE